MPQCRHQGCTRQQAGDLRPWCVEHYIQNKSKAVEGSGPAFYELSSETRLAVGRAAMGRLASHITSTGEYAAPRDYIGAGILSRMAEAITQKPCVAVCLLGGVLIIGYNAGRFSQPQSTDLTKVKTVASEAGIEIASLIYVTSGQARLLHFKSKQVTTITDPAIVDTRPRVHAEMRVLGVLDHLIVNGGFAVPDLVSGYSPEHRYDNTVFLGDDPGGAIWIYVDKPCCAKCETVLRAYDNQATTDATTEGALVRRPLIARTGFAAGYDFDWRLPVPLRWLELTIQYSILKKATSA